jgi:hypothetical protein
VSNYGVSDGYGGNDRPYLQGGELASSGPRRRRRRRGGCLLTGLIVLVVLLVGADFAAKAVAQNEAASQIQQAGFPKKPSVTIEGFPFLTQVLAHNIGQVRLSATDIPEGPVQISQISAVANDIHLNGSFSSGTVSQVTGTVLITFPALANALDNALGPAGQLVGSAGLTLSQAGPDEVKASIDLVVTSGSATWRVTRLAGNKLNVSLVGSSGVPASLLQPVSSYTFSVPKLPYGLTVGSVSVTPDGVVGSFSGQNLPFSQ